MVVVESKHNTGGCLAMTSEMPETKRCCDNYHHCSYQIPSSELINAYSGYCFTEITWKCPECGCENEIRYKLQKRRQRRRGVSNALKDSIKKDIIRNGLLNKNHSGSKNPALTSP